MDCDGSCMHACSVMSDFLWPQGLWPPGSSVHEILQARILEWVATSLSRASSRTRPLLHWQAGSLPLSHQGRPPNTHIYTPLNFEEIHDNSLKTSEI